MTASVPRWLIADLSPSQSKVALQHMWREAFGVHAYLPTTKSALIVGLRVAREQHVKSGYGRSTAGRPQICPTARSGISAAEVNAWLRSLPRLDPDNWVGDVQRGGLR